MARVTAVSHHLIRSDATLGELNASRAKVQRWPELLTESEQRLLDALGQDWQQLIPLAEQLGIRRDTLSKTMAGLVDAGHVHVRTAEPSGHAGAPRREYRRVSIVSDRE